MEDPPYRRILADIRRRIAADELPPDERVPLTRPGIGTVVAQEPGRPLKDREQREAELSRERVVKAAIRIADAEGIVSLSMRRIASGLEVATMALYRHVATKDELVREMANAVLGEVALPPVPPEGWRAQLELMAGLQWVLFRRHPWLAQALSVRRQLPNLTAHEGWALRALGGHGLTASTVNYAHVTLFNYVRSTALSFEWEAEILDGGIPDEDLDVDLIFGFGLQRLLDGLDVLITRPG